MRLRDLLSALILLAAPSAAGAHPHVWVDTASEVVFDDKGRITAIRHHWRFDEAFSAYALQGLDTDRDGKYSAAELAPLAKENVESLKDYDFFTFLTVGDYQAGFGAPTDYGVELFGDRLLLHFTLPLAMPLKTQGTTVLSVYDPEYYVDFSLPSIEAVRLNNAPAACRLTVHPAVGPDAEAAAALAQIGADQRALPPGMESLTAGTENTAEIKCGADGPAVAAANAGDAISQMSGAGGTAGDLTALPQGSSTIAEDVPAPATTTEAAVASTIEAGTATSAVPPAVPAQEAAVPPPVSEPSPATVLPRPAIYRLVIAKIAAWQTSFNHDLTDGLKTLKAGGAFWWLGGISFLYGIVHAAGPGHGKVVISSYLVANEARVRRGVALAFASAFVQAVVAVVIIGVMAVVLNMTSMAIDSTASLFEKGSFALVAALGFYLLIRKGRAAWAVFRGGDAHAHHHHHHDHGHGHGHGHDHDASPSPLRGGDRGGAFAAATGGGALSGATAAVLSVGIRPCSGALVVLVFALAQGVFWAGVAATFLMALGTGIAVAALASLAVGAKGLARHFARGDDRRGGQVMLGLELAAAILITTFGTLLFLGTALS